MNDARPAAVGVGGDELRPRGCASSSSTASVMQLLVRGSPSGGSTMPRRVRNAPDCDRLVLLAVEGEGLLERLPRLLAAGPAAGRLAPSARAATLARIVGGGELERLRRLPLGTLDVEGERALTGQGQVAHRVRLELLGLLVDRRPPGRARARPGSGRRARRRGPRPARPPCRSIQAAAASWRAARAARGICA